jgi:hypothetical protein
LFHEHSQYLKKEKRNTAAGQLFVFEANEWLYGARLLPLFQNLIQHWSTAVFVYT